jgi:hypothetical protein
MNSYLNNLGFNFIRENYAFVSSQSMRSKHAFAHMQHLILQSIQASHEFKQKRQHPIQVLHIEVAVLLHFIHLLEISLSIFSTFGSSTFGFSTFGSSTFGSSTKSTFTKVISAIIII